MEALCTRVTSACVGRTLLSLRMLAVRKRDCGKKWERKKERRERKKREEREREKERRVKNIDFGRKGERGGWK